MNGLVKMFFNQGMVMMKQMNAESERRKEEILDKWELTYKMPRKMKKRVRKELNLDWAIANWNPMGDICSDFETFF